MDDKKFISDEELQSFGETVDFEQVAAALLNQQKNKWKLLADNYGRLENVVVKEFAVRGNKILIQNNPERIISSSAKVDRDSINNRECFLCTENLPGEQKGIKLFSNYVLLCNPFPIFKRHYTIVNSTHIPQSILLNFEDLLILTEMLGPKLSVFYNGPECGASAPDHLHFQACPTEVMPILNLGNNYGTLKIIDEVEVFSVDDGLRKYISLHSKNREQLVKVFAKIYNGVKKLDDSLFEPKMNIFTTYISGCWKILIFPREKHRPACFFDTEENRILISPAAVDIAGLMILPRRKDYLKIDDEEIVKIFSEVLYSEEKFGQLKFLISQL